MARISTYAIDTVVHPQDKWVGTDISGATRNYSAEKIAEYLNNYNAVGINGQANFLFQNQLSPIGRQPGTISFDLGGGAGTSLVSITTLKFSKFAKTENLILDYLQSLVGYDVMLCQLDDINNFAVYQLVSLTQDIDEPNFYDAVLSSSFGNGNLTLDKYYGITPFAAQVSGSIDTVTSYRSDAVQNTIYAGYLLNSLPEITKYIDGVLTFAQGVTDLETDWANRLTLTYL
jgi:hypothetical protein